MWSFPISSRARTLSDRETVASLRLDLLGGFNQLHSVRPAGLKRIAYEFSRIAENLRILTLRGKPTGSEGSLLDCGLGP